MARGDHQEHVHTRETLGKTGGIVEVDAADGQRSLDLPGIASSEDGVVVVRQPLGDERAQSVGCAGDQ